MYLRRGLQETRVALSEATDNPGHMVGLATVLGLDAWLEGEPVTPQI